jgi:hypothetical protein
MDKFEELKFLHDRAQRFSERRQNTSQTYLTLNTAILGALAFLTKDSGFQGWNLIFVSIPLFGVGLIACSIWHRIIRNLESRIGWHYQQVRQIEKKIPESHLTINKEWDEFFQSKGGKPFSFSSLEAQLPRLLMALYAVYGLSLIVAVFLSLI